MNNSSSAGVNCSRTNETQSSHILKTVLLILIGGCGSFGNIFIIVLALKHTVRKNLHHLIVNMAVADNIVVLSTFALEIPVLFDHRAWKIVENYSGNIFCKIFAFLIGAGMWQLFISLFIISIERFRATKLTVHRSRSYSVNRRMAVIAGCWLVVIAMASHELYYASIVNYQNVIYNCDYFGGLESIWNMVLSLISAPLHITIFVLSFITLRRLSRGHMNRFNLSETQRKTRKKQMANGIKLVLSSLALFWVCYLPRTIGNVLHLYWTAQNDKFCINNNVYDYVVACLPLVNACFSPCIYMMFVSDFRMAAKKLICKRAQTIELRKNHDQQQTR